jgi:N-acetylmuramoyl-L-alanine amidase
MADVLSGTRRPRAARLLMIVPLAAALAGCADRVRVPSENFNSRISVVVIHHTSEDFGEALETLTRRSANPVSSHYLIPEPDDPTYGDGKLRVYELVPETHRAWHAGDSYWAGRTALNDQSIGIELVNQTWCHRGDPLEDAAVSPAGMPVTSGPNPSPIDESTAIPDLDPDSICFYPDFADSQVELLAELLADILERHPNIRPTHIVGHADIAPDRKIDPGPRFPWQRLYRLGFGAWYDDQAVIRWWERFRREPLPLLNVQRALAAYGYRIEPTGVLDAQTRSVLRAFQMHFRPSQAYGRPGVETVATLFALIEKYYPEQLDGQPER